MTEFSELVGKTLSKIDRIVGGDGDELVFVAVDGERYRMWHSRDCCENVSIEDICGDLLDMIGSPILTAECASNSSGPGEDDSWTWTFYKLSTIAGSVTIRWYGSSNGYYSERVDFEHINADESRA